MKGTLFVVATPIGNLEDITYRAVRTLQEVDYIACENKDRHLKLLRHLEIKTPALEYSPANERNSAKGLLKLLCEGKSVALVSDAGVPAISDPGRILVAEAAAAGIEIVPIPGASALTTIASVSGFHTDRIVFLGFLSKKPGKIAKELNLLKAMDCCIVVFCSHFQFKKVMETAYKNLGNVEIIIGREMTKINEEYIRTTAEKALEMEITEKGEFTIAFNYIYSKKKGDEIDDE